MIADGWKGRWRCRTGGSSTPVSFPRGGTRTRQRRVLVAATAELALLLLLLLLHDQPVEQRLHQVQVLQGCLHVLLHAEKWYSHT